MLKSGKKIRHDESLGGYKAEIGERVAGGGGLEREGVWKVVQVGKPQ